MASSLLSEFDVVRIDLFWNMCIAIENVSALISVERRFGDRPMVVWGVHVALR